MSSEISTDATDSYVDSDPQARPSYVAADLQNPPSDSLQPWQFFTLAGLIGATIVVFVSRGHTPAGIVLLSFTVFAAAIVGIAAWRMLVPFTRRMEESRAPVVSGRTRAALEREKQLVLRSIKELEFDRAMGKVSEQDFAEMSGRLRQRATRLITQLDAGVSYRDQIQKEVARRMADRPVHAGADGASAPGNAVKCPHCGTANDTDAKFCKRCGASLETSE